ncbi:MAG: protein kinase [Gammaproteobacteria bacterium]|nr:protein kinase [Gammaproteobacteria bacterium]
MEGLENQSLGKYAIQRRIGRGSMGTVYLGYDTFNQRQVAIKVANADSSKPEKLVRRHRKLLLNEAKASGLLRHPNIVAVYDVGVEENIHYLVMEYVEQHETLADYCSPNQLLPVKTVVEIMLKCAIAFDYAHRKGIVHRDIKPKNIMLTCDREVKIGDFGIALITQTEDAANTQVHGYIGSPLYMSPEQARGENIGNQSDIFCIGVVMYELLTGVHPFAADTLPRISHKIRKEPHIPISALRPELPAVLSRVIDRTLKKHPAGRYSRGIDIAGDLSLIFDHIKVPREDLSGREKFARVKPLAFFQEFDEPEIWEVINASLWQDFGKNEEIIAEGEDVSSFYVLVSGAVDIAKNNKVIGRLEPGNCFGEIGDITKKGRSARVVATQPSTVMKVRSSLVERTSQSCQLRLHRAFLSTMAARLFRATELLANWNTADQPPVRPTR